MQNTPPRDRYLFAGYISLMHKIFAVRRKIFKPALPHLSDHYAKDMGFSPAELEQHRFVPPSQTNRHPML